MDRALDAQPAAFSLDELIATINQDVRSSEHSKMVLENLFGSAKSWGIFEKEGTELKELFIGGQASVLDISAYGQVAHGMKIKALVVGLLCERLLKERLIARKEEEATLIREGAYLTEGDVHAGEKAPLVWILIDEAHNFLPNDHETLASWPLIRILREGRQPGLTLILCTQQPGAIAIDALTQSDIVLSHRLTAKKDIDALSQVMQTYLPTALQRYIRELPSEKGSAVVLDDKLERIYPLQVRPRTSWHGGSAPTAIPKDVIKAIERAKKAKADAEKLAAESGSIFGHLNK